MERLTKKLKLSLLHAHDLWYFINEDQEEAFSKKYLLKSTVSSMKWTAGNFTLWKKPRDE